MLFLLLLSTLNCTQLHPLIEEKQWNQIEIALNQNPRLWHCKDPYNIPLLHHFAYHNQVKLLKKGVEQQKISQNIVDFRKWTLLHAAVAGNAPETTAYLLSREKICLTCKTEKRHLPIFLGIRRNAIDAVAIFVNKKQGINLRDHHNRTVLMATIATLKDPGKMFDILLKGGNLNAADRYGNRAIHWALYTGQISLVKKLIAAGADYRSGNSDGLTPMMLVAASGDLPLIRYFLNKKIDLNRQDRSGETALHHAIRGNEEQAPLALLIDHGASLSIRDHRGFTPLMRAIHNTASLRLIKQLIDAGAPLHIGDKAQTDLLTWLSTQNDIKTSPRILSKTVLFLLRYGLGADQPESASIWQYSAKIAAAGGSIKLLNTLKNQGITPWNHPDIIIAAVKQNQPKTLRWLLKQGAPVNGENTGGKTPLIEAILLDNYPVIQLLLHHGASPIQRDRFGKTAFNYLNQKQITIKEILKLYSKKFK